MDPAVRVAHTQGLKETLGEIVKRLGKSEDAHKRIDELEKKLPSVDHIAGIAGGAVSVMLEEIRRQLGELKAATESDESADRELIVAVRELVEVMKKPSMRTVEIMLPSGPAKMTIHETRDT